MNFLVVDNNMLLCRFMVQYLESKGHTARWLAKPTKTITRLLDTEFDAVILDIEMPEMDGYQVLTAIRERQEFDHIKVIIFTGLGYDEEAMQKARKLGAQGFVSKGLSPSDIYEALMKVAES